MTTITIRKTKLGEYSGFNCIGHAEFAEEGRDIVCAAVSMLVINTLNSLEELLHVPMKVVSNEEAGLIDCCFEDSLSEKATLLMDSLVLGLKQTKLEYGKKYLELKFEEVQDHVKIKPSIFRS